MGMESGNISDNALKAVSQVCAQHLRIMINNNDTSNIILVIECFRMAYDDCPGLKASAPERKNIPENNVSGICRVSYKKISQNYFISS